VPNVSIQKQLSVNNLGAGRHKGGGIGDEKFVVSEQKKYRGGLYLQAGMATGRRAEPGLRELSAFPTTEKNETLLWGR